MFLRLILDEFCDHLYWFSSIDASTRQDYKRAIDPRIHTHSTQTVVARNEFLRRDQASPVSSGMHLDIKTLGPYRIAPIQIHHLGPIALRYLTDTIILSVNSAKIPNIWKVGRVIPLQKPGKPIEKLQTNCTPLSHCKTTKKLLLSDFIEYPPKVHQHGFRPEHSTLTVLNIVTNNIQKGLNQRKPCNRTLLVGTHHYRTALIDGSLHTYKTGFLT